MAPLLDGARKGDAPQRTAAAARRGVGGCPTNDACWLDGVGTQQTFVNCVIGGTGYVYSYVGYWGKDDFSYPQVGDRYWGHIVSGVVGSACGGEFIGTDVELPATTQFALDNTPEGKIRCFYTSGNTGNTEEITNNPNADCKQNPGGGVNGGWGLGGRIIPAYGTFEVIFPIRSTKENLGTSKLRAAIDTAISYPDVAYPEAVVAVTTRHPRPDPDPDPTPRPDSAGHPTERKARGVRQAAQGDRHGHGGPDRRRHRSNPVPKRQEGQAVPEGRHVVRQGRSDGRLLALVQTTFRRQVQGDRDDRRRSRKRLRGGDPHGHREVLRHRASGRGLLPGGIRIQQRGLQAFQPGGRCGARGLRGFPSHLGIDPPAFESTPGSRRN